MSNLLSNGQPLLSTEISTARPEISTAPLEISTSPEISTFLSAASNYPAHYRVLTTSSLKKLDAQQHHP